MNAPVVRGDGGAPRSGILDSPLVTVAMPAYNAELWIARAIESVLGQTLSDWELIVVNDGSTDGTAAVVRTFRDSRVRMVCQDNGGAALARNTAMRHARGRYVALLDADDWYEPRHLERTTGFLDQHPTCSLVGTNYYFINYRGERILGCRPREILGKDGDGVIPDYFRAAMRNRCYPITCCAVFRRELIPQLGEFDENLPSDEDHDFWTRWAMRSRFGYIDEPLCYYQTDTPGSNRKNLESSVRARVRSWEKLTAMESEAMPFWDSYARCRSFYLYRLTALAIAVGLIDEAHSVGTFWPTSPNHVHWWLAKSLIALPDFCLRGIHGLLGRMDFVKYRQGRSAPVDGRVDCDQA